MKLPWILFALLLVLCVIVAIAMAIPEPPGGYSSEHPTYKSMHSSNDGGGRHARILWVGAIWGVVQITFIVSCLALGMANRGRLGNRKWVFILGLLIWQTIFVLLVISYGQYTEGSRELYLSFPAPTALLLYGLWPLPIFFVIVYIVSFRRWVINRDGLEKFEEIVRARRQREGNAG